MEQNLGLKYDDTHGTYNASSQIKFKTTMLKSSLCDYSDVYILAKRTTTAIGQRADAAAIVVDRNDKEVIFKNCAPLTDSISEIRNTQVDNVKDLDFVMPMY